MFKDAVGLRRGKLASMKLAKTVERSDSQCNSLMEGQVIKG